MNSPRVVTQQDDISVNIMKYRDTVFIIGFKRVKITSNLIIGDEKTNKKIN